MTTAKRSRARIGFGVAGAFLVLTAAGCGSASEKIAEKATEKAMEQAGAGDVDIDTKDGSVAIKTGEGSMSFDEDGNYTMTDKDGGAITSGATTDLPEGWPSEVKLPKGVKIVTATTNTLDGAEMMSVGANFDGDLKEVQESVKAQLEDAGFEITGDSVSTSSNGSGYASVQATNQTIQVGVSLMGAEGDDSLITYTISPAEEE